MVNSPAPPPVASKPFDEDVISDCKGVSNDLLPLFHKAPLPSKQYDKDIISDCKGVSNDLISLFNEAATENKKSNESNGSIDKVVSVESPCLSPSSIMTVKDYMRAGIGNSGLTSTQSSDGAKTSNSLVSIASPCSLPSPPTVVKEWLKHSTPKHNYYDQDDYLQGNAPCSPDYNLFMELEEEKMQKKQMKNNNEKQVQRLREIGRKRKIGDDELVI